MGKTLKYINYQLDQNEFRDPRVFAKLHSDILMSTFLTIKHNCGFPAGSSCFELDKVFVAGILSSIEVGVTKKKLAARLGELREIKKRLADMKDETNLSVQLYYFQMTGALTWIIFWLEDKRLPSQITGELSKELKKAKRGSKNVLDALSDPYRRKDMMMDFELLSFPDADYWKKPIEDLNSDPDGGIYDRLILEDFLQTDTADQIGIWIVDAIEAEKIRKTSQIFFDIKNRNPSLLDYQLAELDEWKALVASAAGTLETLESNTPVIEEYIFDLMYPPTAD